MNKSDDEIIRCEKCDMIMVTDGEIHADEYSNTCFEYECEQCGCVVRIEV